MPRSRNGCATCRQRRVKCDEARPACRRCIQGHFTCSGFEPAKLAHSSIKVMDRSNPHAMQYLRVQSYNIPFYAPGGPVERKALHYFFSYASRDVSGLTAVGFWDRLVPCMCQRESVVRNSIIAFSLAHYNHAIAGKPAVIGRIDNRPDHDIIASYLKASKALRRYIEHEAAPSRIIVLACCIIFHTIEALLGQPQNAMVHLSKSLDILRTYQMDRSERDGLDLEFAEYIDDLLPVLARLDLSATITNVGRSPELSSMTVGEGGNLPECSLTIASPFRDALDAHNRLIRYSLPLWRYLASNVRFRNVDIREVPESVLEERSRLRRACDEWQKGLREYELEHRDDTLDRMTSLSMLVSGAHNIVGTKLLGESLSDRGDTDLWAEDQQAILRICEEVLRLRDAEKEAQGFQQYGSFSSEVGIVGVLLLLAHRTWSPLVRRRAVELAVKHDRHEGVSDLCEKFMTWVSLPAPRPHLVLLYSGPGH